MKRTLTFALMLTFLAAFLLSGCGYNRTYTSVTTHVDQTTTEDDPSILRAETYQELVSSILHFVSEGEETGTVRLYQYTGDVESDLEAACQEVLEEDPLGAYALSGLEHDYSRIVSYYECNFTFVFRRSAEEIDAVSTADSTVSFREQLQQTMDEFGDSLALRTSRTITEEDIQEMVTEYYYDTPTLALGLPSIEVNSYGGEESSQKIIEVIFNYEQSTEESLEMQEELLATAYSLLNDLDATADASGLWSIYSELSSYTIYQSMNSNSAYRFLTNQAGAPDGASLSLLLLCQLLGLEAQYVEGSTEGLDEHGWVMVQIGETWCQMDLILSDDENGFLHSDDDLLALGYSWDQTAYPACAGLQLEEETQEDTEESEQAVEEESESSNAVDEITGLDENTDLDLSDQLSAIGE